jgi:hypothetical protein
MTLSWLMRAPGQFRKVAQARARSLRRTIPAITRSDFQPLQIWRVRSGESRPSRQFHSSGMSPVSNSPLNSFGKRSRAASTVSASSTFRGRRNRPH